VAAAIPLVPEAEYQWCTGTTSPPSGGAGYDKYRREFAQLIWRLASAPLQCPALKRPATPGPGGRHEAYPQDLPVMRDLLPTIETPVQIIAGARDQVVPPVNAEYLYDRLPKSKLDILDTGHFTWEDGADQYAALVTSWWAGGYARAGAGASR
jgi:pimeloyl-ACP methyl ester carboxylesterase